MTMLRWLIPLALVGLLLGCDTAPDSTLITSDPVSTQSEPESSPAAARPEGMISAANPYAVAAGETVLARGGSAVDAAIAAHAVLGLVEPQSSGLGGGGFMLVHDAERNRTLTLDGRETAPAEARPDMFLDANGEPLPYLERVQSGHATGVPGTVALYEAAHERYGRLEWAELFDHAIELAEHGFEVSPRLHGLLERVGAVTALDEHPETAAYFFPEGEPLAVGSLRDNPDYARTLRRIASEGSRAFYQGDIAEAIVERVSEPPHGGALSVADFEAYKVIEREPVCGPYRDYRVCSMPPPSSGVALIQMLGLIERLAPAGIHHNAAGWATVIDAMKLGYADRDHYVADADQVPVPVDALLDSRYLDHRARQKPAPDVPAEPGDPGVVLGNEPLRPQWHWLPTTLEHGTSHLSVVDSEGNAVGFTASVEFAFGAQRMAEGFILNNQLTDFASRPTVDNTPVANAVAPGKRPRSSMTPTLVFDSDDALRLVTGSPGGNSIIAYTLKSIVGVLDMSLTPEQAIVLPNIVARNLPVQVEEERTEASLLAGLRARGYPTEARGGENSGLHLIEVHEGRLQGGADPRREGRVGRVISAETAD